jgi:hypothetical protein
VLSSVEIGSKSGYSERLNATFFVATLADLLLAAAVIDLTVRAASSKDAIDISSEYANAVFSPLTARTPTPWSILKLPVLTIPSSKLQPSERVYWKYKSASSTLCALISFKAFAKCDSVKPNGVSSSFLAMAMRCSVGSICGAGRLVCSRVCSALSWEDVGDFRESALKIMPTL